MALKRMIQWTGLYQYIKYSRLFRQYQRLFKPEVVAAHRKEVGLYRRILGKADLVFDIGAYDGHKTAAFLEVADRVVACEPDRRSFRLLKIRFRGLRRRVTVLRTAVADRVGTGVLYVHHPGSAFNTLNGAWRDMLEADRGVRWEEDISFESDDEVRVTTLDELIRIYGAPHFIKIDVEGYEKRVFDGLSRAVPIVSFECQLPEFRDDLFVILDRLISFGGALRFNVIYREEWMFEEFITFAALREWIDETKLFSFDVVARTDENRGI